MLVFHPQAMAAVCVGILIFCKPLEVPAWVDVKYTIQPRRPWEFP